MNEDGSVILGKISYPWKEANKKRIHWTCRLRLASLLTLFFLLTLLMCRNSDAVTE